MRELIRSIAKARLEAMSVPHVNKIFGMGVKNPRARRLQRTRSGRELFEKLRSEHEPVWRRVIFGSLAEDGIKAQMNPSRKRKGGLVKDGRVQV